MLKNRIINPDIMKANSGKQNISHDNSINSEVNNMESCDDKLLKKKHKHSHKHDKEKKHKKEHKQKHKTNHI
jgi:hypothetical protein